ncbi:unnamed protein product [Pleuronectes platessa]|uniref:Uncharacterized protein n=1 Tax=Pleuronectes platessa TaxID=8262 RepID=A0A9N7TM65_PLEPL|nr:unnamed protein product [Pleuronectes platessa]
MVRLTGRDKQANEQATEETSAQVTGMYSVVVLESTLFELDLSTTELPLRRRAGTGGIWFRRRKVEGYPPPSILGASRLSEFSCPPVAPIECQMCVTPDSRPPACDLRRARGRILGNFSLASNTVDRGAFLSSTDVRSHLLCGCLAFTVSSASPARGFENRGAFASDSGWQSPGFLKANITAKDELQAAPRHRSIETGDRPSPGRLLLFKPRSQKIQVDCVPEPSSHSYSPNAVKDLNTDRPEPARPGKPPR